MLADLEHFAGFADYELFGTLRKDYGGHRRRLGHDKPHRQNFSNKSRNAPGFQGSLHFQAQAYRLRAYANQKAFFFDHLQQLF